MSTMNGWQLQCANTTCIPFATVIVANIRKCQITCLAEVQCKTASFHKLTSNCELFPEIPNSNTNMVANMDTVTMIVIDGTRIPPG